MLLQQAFYRWSCLPSPHYRVFNQSQAMMLKTANIRKAELQQNGGFITARNKPDLDRHHTMSQQQVSHVLVDLLDHTGLRASCLWQLL